jgi:EAL domain-containing protein (putative c-di-GMP-specific phosphodiesterase class I)
VDARRARDLAVETERAEKVARISEVLETGAIEMLFQPIVEIDSGHIAGFESLARFHHPVFRGPDAWFAEAAEVGLGQELELDAICRAVASVPLLPTDTHLALNVSAETATSPMLERIVASMSGVRPVIELTEHTVVDDYDELLVHLDRLRELGALIAVDDAGTGYAGLQHILRLRPDVVKLDRELVMGIDVDPARYALVSALATFAGQIGAVLVAEGIETEPQLTILRDLGIPWGQGFYLAPPAPAGTAHVISIGVGSAM